MLDSIVSSPRVAVLEQALAASSLRQKVISNNIANVNTPEYKKSEVSFEDMLQGAMNGEKLSLRQTNVGHLSLQQSGIPKPKLNVVNTTSMRTDGNNVDIDVEMANLAKNNIYYDAVAQQIGNYFSAIKSVIKEGR